ncbi:MAG: patatin-like phospholipase family protein, partial [Burkholderiaceae bacterium]
MTLEERIARPGPKKILALDGGGIRGLMAVEVVLRLEDMLREKLGRGDDFVLADYFDFVAGTSTGAIIAACVSLGMPMRRIRQFYLDGGKEMFDRASLLKRFYYKFEDDKLAAKLQSEIGPERANDPASGLATLGSARLRTLLMAVTRNATTDSPWPLTNNPRARYNLRTRPDCNLDLPLWKVVRASTAAPTFFPPEVVDLGPRRFVFVDGGVTTYNNPAFLAFVTATAQPYNIGWPTGEDRMLIVSVGTGSAAKLLPKLEPSDMTLIYQ